MAGRFDGAAAFAGAADAKQLINPIVFAPYCTNPDSVGAECATVISD
jgi:hypothetical protein